MVNLQTIRSTPTVDVVKAVAFGQEVFERLARRLERCSGRPIVDPEVRRLLRLPAATLVGDARSVRPDIHRRRKVRQIQQKARRPDGEPAPGIEAEEVHTW